MSVLLEWDSHWLGAELPGGDSVPESQRHFYFKPALHDETRAVPVVLIIVANGQASLSQPVMSLVLVSVLVSPVELMMPCSPYMVALGYLLVLTIKLSLLKRHFWHGLNLKQTNIIVFCVPTNLTEFSDENKKFVCVCVSTYLDSDFSSPGSKALFFLILFQQNALCFVSGFALQSLEIKKKNKWNNTELQEWVKKKVTDYLERLC